MNGNKLIGDWSRDGKAIAFLLQTDEPTAKAGIYGQIIQSGATPFYITRSNVEDDLPRISPDGRWIGYVDDSSGRLEVYVRRFGVEPGPAIQVTSTGGHWPRWNFDGTQLYYRTNQWKLMAVSVKRINPFQLGRPESLFQLPAESEYEVSDDNRILVGAPKGSLISPVSVLINWKPPNTY